MKALKKSGVSFSLYSMACCLIVGFGCTAYGQININGAGAGRAFDGVGGVSGGGGTSPLLMSYIEPYRSQILDYLFKPNFGASINTHFCEIGCDGNSTQGSEASHEHAANDLNCQRGYEWWIMKSAYNRNPAITFDACPWGFPAWLGNWQSSDGQTYFINWVKGLKTTYGITLNAVGIKNESGTFETFATGLRTAFNAAGLTGVLIHGFDNWGGGKWGFNYNTVDVLGVHTTAQCSWSEGNGINTPAAAINTGKKLWDTEEHYMNQNSGYNQATAEVQAFNQNYIMSKITKTLFWYLVDGTYPIEGWTSYGCMDVNQPWCGYYKIKEGLWGYAHYNQFVKVGWLFIDGACGNIAGGGNQSKGSYVTLRSPDNSDFSVIIETKQADANSTLNFTVTGGLPTNKPLCVWRSTDTAHMFEKQADITPAADGSFSITVVPNAIYSISTTTGQQHGTFATPIPASKPFPMPYYDNFDHYATADDDQKLWGYYAYNFCDISSVFEIANNPSGTGKCLRQVVNQKANSWGGEWNPYTIIGSKSWTNYEVSADVYFDNGGYAGVMGRVSSTGNPNGYYMRLASNGDWALYKSNGTALKSGNKALTGQWHNVKLQMDGQTLTGSIENTQVCTATDGSYSSGMAGLTTNGTAGSRTAMFDNFIINTVNGPTPAPTVFTHDAYPPYSFIDPGKVAAAPERPLQARPTPALTLYKVVGGQLMAPKEFSGRTVAAAVYDLKGRLVSKTIAKSQAKNLRSNYAVSRDVFIVKLKAID